MALQVFTSTAATQLKQLHIATGNGEGQGGILGGDREVLGSNKKTTRKERQGATVCGPSGVVR